MVGRALPAREEALRVFRERFLNRTDYVAVLAPWEKPCPVEANGTLDDLLLGHLFGRDVPEAKVRYENRRGSGAMKGHFRIGSYCPGPDDTTRWLCLDFDGAGHAGALADPLAAAKRTLDLFRSAGLAAYLERSGGGKGWHLWCFFEPAIPAAKAQRLGHLLAPKDALLTTGQVADPRSGRGIEVFPKQDKVRRTGKKGFGNLVWLPWWQGAAEGSNVFYRAADAGELETFVPSEFVTVSENDVDHVLRAREAPPASNGTNGVPPRRAASSPAPTNGAGDAAWTEWRRKALAALPVEAVYRTWLTGRSAGPGWLECRDPASATGDQNPSASVADGSGDAERGAFHSFISGRTLSVFDFMVEHCGVLDFRAARARVADLSGVGEPAPPPADPGETWAGPPRRRPKIVIRTAEHEVVDDAIAALARVEGVYCRGQLLVHVVKDASRLAGIIHPTGSLRIVPLGGAGVRDRLTAAADWVSLKERQGEVEEVPAHPPAWASPAVESRKSWPKIRYLEAVVESPVLRPDGTVLDKRGYDDATGLLYMPNTRYPIAPSASTREEAQRAVADLLDVVVDFPFKTAAHRAAWLAGVLTPLARYAFRGPSPLFLMDANVRGAGKSLLADVTGEIIGGRAMPRTPQALDETEEVKRITAIALEGDRVVLIDNINKPLGSGALDTVLTGTVWSERILGKSEKVSLPLLTVWYATGNNITFKGDTARRCLHIRLDSDLEKPETRDGFKHPDLLDWVHANRPRLVTSALTVLRGYCVAGKPSMGLKSWGSFEGWSALVRNALVWAGLPDPGDTRAELDEVDTDSNVLADLISGWEELPGGMGARGCTIAQALEVLRDDSSGSRYGRLRSALGELCSHPPNQLPTAKRVGYALRRFRGRVVSGRKLQTRISSGNNLWFVQHVDKNGADVPAALELPFRANGSGDHADV